MDFLGPWIGNCVGRHNHMWFLLFCFSTGTLSAMTCCASLAHGALSWRSSGVESMMTWFVIFEPLVGFCLFFTGILTMLPFGMFMSHCGLLLAGRTTYDIIKGMNVSSSVIIDARPLYRAGLGHACIDIDSL